MHYTFADFNGADVYFGRAGAAEWRDVQATIAQMPVFLQPSDQAGKVGTPIFDPKATNAYMSDELTGPRARKGWSKVPVPHDLHAFGLDWDGGKNETLAEWQFSNYPFLWNNVIRSEAVYKSGIRVGELARVRALIVVTKGGLFPASNSTLYYEQALAQLHAVTKFQAFAIPIRLVGLLIPPNAARIDIKWTVYPGRYSRAGTATTDRRATVVWRRRERFEYDFAQIELE